MTKNILDASCRVAFAALIHDLGKFAQRADMPCDPKTLDIHKQLYCPRHQDAKGNFLYWSHIHGAYTALGFDVIEKIAPNLVQGDMFPFAGDKANQTEVTDSLINAAASHHYPQTFIQQIITVADCVSSGFEREEFEEYNRSQAPENYKSARLRSLFENIRLASNALSSSNFAYPLSELTAESIFPESRTELEPTSKEKATKEYRLLWDNFVQALNLIPHSHRQQWALWLDHFDTLWKSFTVNIPSATSFNVKPEVSLYDHSKSTAALAVALWRWHQENQTDNSESITALKTRNDWDEKKFLLIQGDFFGIQNFIFTNGSRTQKASAKLLRGRSFYVSLLSELAALKILEALDLPSTSQIINAAGKFLIVAPNTPNTHEKLTLVQKEIDQWFMEQTFATSSIGFAWTSASCNDLLSKKFSALTRELFEALEIKKFQQFALPENSHLVFNPNYGNGTSEYDDRLPQHSLLPNDQILIGEKLVKQKRILVLDGQEGVNEGLVSLKLPIFGYQIAFSDSEEQDGKYGKLAQLCTLRRCWDYSMPTSMNESLWKGYARRNINGYVARFASLEEQYEPRYKQVDDELINSSLIKSFAHIACEERQEAVFGQGTELIGQVGVMALKGDIDNLGQIFQRGLSNNTFAKMASLSRQVNEFFSIYLPVLCLQSFPNTYTVFAGGDDFFLIGPWSQTQQLAYRLQEDFKRYVKNAEIHFSCGLTMVHPDTPVRTIARLSEESLSQAKRAGKNRITCFGTTVTWDDWDHLQSVEDFFEASSQRYGLSNSYFYSLFSVIEMAQKQDDPNATIWRSRLYYKTARMADGQRNKEALQYIRAEFLPQLIQLIERNGRSLRIPLSNYFYRYRC